MEDSKTNLDDNAIQVKTREAKKGILLVAYGSSNTQASSAVRTFQSRLEKDFSMPVRLAFTSETMRMRLAHAKTKSDSVLKALEKMYFERFTYVAVQTLHLIPGLEYEDVLGDIALAKEKMPLRIEAGEPLLSKNSDMLYVAKALYSLVPKNFAPNDCLLWMGHGSEHEAEKYYDEIARVVHELDPRLHIACMEGKNTLETVLTRWQEDCFSSQNEGAHTHDIENQSLQPYISSIGIAKDSKLAEIPESLEVLSMQKNSKKKVWLLPLLTTIGRHALHDMAGAQASSWKSRIEQAGYICEPYMHGLAESKALQDIWIERLKKAL